jgi:DNA polymerase
VSAGAAKFALTTKLPLRDAQNIVNIYRNSYRHVVGLWDRCDEALGKIAKGVVGAKVDFRGIITTAKGGLLLPNGLMVKYPDLRWNVRVVTKTGKVIDYEGWSYFDGRARQNIYGAKVVENIVQALARIVVLTQTLMVPRRLVLSVHDEGVWCVPIRDVLQTVFEVNWALRQPLPWCSDLPLNCEVGSHRSYGKAKP